VNGGVEISQKPFVSRQNHPDSGNSERFVGVVSSGNSNVEYPHREREPRNH